MILIMMHEWYGPNSKFKANATVNATIASKERIITFASRMTFGEAIKYIYKYQCAFNDHFYVSAIEYELLMANEVDDLTDEQLKMAGINLAELLPQTKEDVEK